MDGPDLGVFPTGGLKHPVDVNKLSYDLCLFSLIITSHMKMQHI